MENKATWEKPAITVEEIKNTLGPAQSGTADAIVGFTS